METYILERDPMQTLPVQLNQYNRQSFKSVTKAVKLNKLFPDRKEQSKVIDLLCKDKNVNIKDMLLER